jgi:hypothetical protein
MVLSYFIQKFFETLNKLPNQNKTVYRGIKNENLRKIFNDKKLIGCKVYWNSFTSATTSLEIAKQFATNKGIIFKIKTFNAKFISPFSVYKNKNEILILPNSTFAIIKCDFEEDGFSFVKLSQIKVNISDI